MKKFLMYNNYYFVGKNEKGGYYLSLEPTQPDLDIPNIFIAKDLGGIEVEIDSNFVSVVWLESDEKGNESIVLYHVTMDEYLEGVMEKGLEPNCGRLSRLIGESKDRVYLFPNGYTMDDALMNWMGEAYEEIADEDGIDADDLLLHSLKVKIPVSEYTEFLEESLVGYEVICKKTVPAEWITYHSEQ